MQTLRKYNASDLMVADPPVVEPEISVASLARGVLELNPRVCYFVEDAGKLAGIVSAYQMRASALREEFARGGSLQFVLLRYTQALITQISQTAVCNRLHSVEQRLCRWLLL